MKGKLKKLGPRLTISLTGKDYANLNALAMKNEVSASWVVRRAIDEYLRNHRHELGRQGALLSPYSKGKTSSANSHSQR